MNIHVNGHDKPLTNVGRNMAHIFARNPAYPDLLARCRREDRRLSLIEHEVQALWCPVFWRDEWLNQYRGEMRNGK